MTDTERLDWIFKYLNIINDKFNRVTGVGCGCCSNEVPIEGALSFREALDRAIESRKFL